MSFFVYYPLISPGQISHQIWRESGITEADITGTTSGVRRQSIDDVWCAGLDGQRCDSTFLATNPNITDAEEAGLVVDEDWEDDATYLWEQYLEAKLVNGTLTKKDLPLIEWLNTNSWSYNGHLYLDEINEEPDHEDFTLDDQEELLAEEMDTYVSKNRLKEMRQRDDDRVMAKSKPWQDTRCWKRYRRTQYQGNQTHHRRSQQQRMPRRNVEAHQLTLAA